MNTQPADRKPPILSTLPTEDPDFREIAEEFIETVRKRADEMLRAREAGDFEELSRLAHWLRGSGGTAGYGVFTQPASQLEELATAQEVDQIEVDQIEVVLQEIVDLSARASVATE